MICSAPCSSRKARKLRRNPIRAHAALFHPGSPWYVRTDPLYRYCCPHPVRRRANPPNHNMLPLSEDQSQGKTGTWPAGYTLPTGGPRVGMKTPAGLRGPSPCALLEDASGPATFPNPSGAFRLMGNPPSVIRLRQHGMLRPRRRWRRSTDPGRPPAPAR